MKNETPHTASNSSILVAGQSMLELLKYAFYRNAYFRVPNPDRRHDEPHDYKKGYEIRLVLESKEEVTAVQRALKKFQFRLSAPYEHGRHRIIQPIYGKKAVARFCDLLSLSTDEVPPAIPRDST